MDLKTQNGFELIKSEELHKWKEIAKFVPIVRNSISKTWRLVNQLDGMMKETVDVKPANTPDK